MTQKSKTKFSPPGESHQHDTRRTIRVGSSLAVTVPFRVVRAFELQPGDFVGVLFTRLEVEVARPALVKVRMEELMARLEPALAWLAPYDQ